MAVNDNRDQEKMRDAAEPMYNALLMVYKAAVAGDGIVLNRGSRFTKEVRRALKKAGRRL